MKYLTLALVVLGLWACSPNPLYVPPVPAGTPRCIDWSTVPEAGPYVEPVRPTANEQAFKREAKRAYIALQFERPHS